MNSKVSTLIYVPSTNYKNFDYTKKQLSIEMENRYKAVMKILEEEHLGGCKNILILASTLDSPGHAIGDIFLKGLGSKYFIQRKGYEYFSSRDTDNSLCFRTVYGIMFFSEPLSVDCIIFVGMRDSMEKILRFGDTYFLIHHMQRSLKMQVRPIVLLTNESKCIPIHVPFLVNV